MTILDSLSRLLFWYLFSILIVVHGDHVSTLFIGTSMLGCWLVRYGIAGHRGL